MHRTFVRATFAAVLTVASVPNEAEAAIVVGVDQEASLDFRFDPNGNQNSSGLNVRIRNSGNGVSVFGFDLTPVAEALAANPGFVVEEVEMQLTHAIPWIPGVEVDATMQMSWGVNDIIDAWDETTVTPNTSRWDNNALQWNVGPSVIVGSFFRPGGDPAGMIYSVNTPELIDMVSNDANGYATLVIFTEDNTPGGGASGWGNAAFEPVSLEVTIIPEPATACLLVLGIVAVASSRRRGRTT